MKETDESSMIQRKEQRRQATVHIFLQKIKKKWPIIKQVQKEELDEMKLT